MTLNGRIREQRLQNAVTKLSKYYGLRTANEELVGIVDRTLSSEYGSAGRITPSATDVNASRALADPVDKKISTIVDQIFNSTIGAVNTEDLATEINNQITNTTTSDDAPSTADLENAYGTMMQIIGDGERVRTLRRTFPDPPYEKLRYVNIKNSNSGASDGSSFASIPMLTNLNENAGQMSIILINSPNLSISNRYTKAVSIFLNGVPPIELSKAVPYLEVNFEFPISAVDSSTNRLLAPSIYKLILGGVQATPGSTLYTLQTANSSSQLPGASSTTPNFTGLGMEAFTSPQTLFFNRNQANAEARYNGILDPTRPILSIKQFSTSEVPSYSTFGYRTATLQLKLHDRSRMPDLASFFRADLRGNTRLDIEYGWHHPEGEMLNNRNPNVSAYVDLINGMRRREKFQIRNSSFRFVETGGVEITLELVTLGQSQLGSEIIINNSETSATAIRDLNELQERLSTIIATTSLRDSSSDDQRPTVRLSGIEVLEPASDAFSSGFNLNRQQRTEFSRLLSSLRDREGGAAGATFARIRSDLERIWGTRGAGGDDTSVGIVRDSLTNDINTVLIDMAQYIDGRPPPPDTTRGRRSRTPTIGWPSGVSGDPLVIRTNRNPPVVGNGREGLPGLLGAPPLEHDRSLPSWIRENNYQNKSVSLATIIANFIGKPLMNSNAYEEVQFIYYPFNENAAYANRINIGNFEVNLGMFAERLLNYRLNNASRSGNFTLNEFWSFLTTNIISDYSASSYGLWDTNGPLFSRPTRRTDEEDRWSTRVSRDETTYNSRLSVLLRTITPTGEFRPPQLRMFTECLPKRSIAETDSTTTDVSIRRSILRIHIYDQQSSAVAGIGELLMAERNRALSLEERPSGYETTLGDSITARLWARYRRRLIESAQNSGIIRNAGGTAATEQRFEIVGGSRSIKNFVMNQMPYILPGTQHSNVKSVNLSSLQDEAASTLNLVNAPRPSELVAPNGEEPSGLPLQVIPVEMNIVTQGCPLITFGNQFFVDLNTGTTADDLYAVNRVESTLEMGSYKTTLKLRPISGYTRYRNYLNEIRNAITRLRDLTGSDEGISDAIASEAEASAAEDFDRANRSGGDEIYDVDPDFDL